MIRPRILFFALIAGVLVASPLMHDVHAHQALDRFVDRWVWGTPILGIDVTAVRENIFSLALDLRHSVTVIDHNRARSFPVAGVLNYMTRGGSDTTGDVLRWLRIPVTARQAAAINPCRLIGDLGSERTIVVRADPVQQGVASWYGPRFHGRLSASGEVYNMYDDTAAHRTLRLGTVVRVFGLRTGNSTVVRINDRGPYVAGRIIDLSLRAKERLGMRDLAGVYLERIDPDALSVNCK